ncbi:hypothetical protein C8Q79DRAFT_927162 [Trametes meyenii]|nr:hypothetical protein C8Q79DRAFT_927162 [Trametes meyenii]
MSQSQDVPVPMDLEPAASPSGGGLANRPRVTGPPGEPKIAKQQQDSKVLNLKIHTIEEALKDRKNVFTNEEKTEAWGKIKGAMEDHGDAMIKRWNKEIDTYLVFAGLLSVILTPFNVESYHLLQPPPPDPGLATAAALQHISEQLSSFATGPVSTVWLNGLWFTSLILSLASSSISIIVKQWLSEYSAGVSGATREAACIRQYRLDNLEKWHVGAIVGSIPVLLQVALALFLAGLLVLLYPLHQGVASASAFFVGLLGIFTLVTMVLPVAKPGCSYKSRLALAFLRLIPYTVYMIRRYLIVFFARISRWAWWHSPSGSVTEHILNVLDNGLHKLLGERDGNDLPIRHNLPQWRTREKALVDHREDLDREAIVTAYKITMTFETLSAAATCIVDLEPTVALGCFEKLHDADTQHFGPDPYDAVVRSAKPASHMLWLDCLVCMVGSKSREQNLRVETVKRLDNYLWPSFKMMSAPGADQDPYPETEKVLLRLSAVATADQIQNHAALFKDFKESIQAFSTRILRSHGEGSGEHVNEINEVTLYHAS